VAHRTETIGQLVLAEWLTNDVDGVHVADRYDEKRILFFSCEVYSVHIFTDAVFHNLETSIFMICAFDILLCMLFGISKLTSVGLFTPTDHTGQYWTTSDFTSCDRVCM